MNCRRPLLALCAALFATATTARAADPSPPEFRLGDAAAPIDYAVRLAIDPNDTRFAGEIRIRLRFSRATPVLWLDATKLDIESAQVEQDGKPVALRVVPGGEDFVGFAATEAPFAAGEAVAVIRYRGPLEPLATRGLFREQERGKWYVISQLEAIDARRAFPCFDEPQWKTPWKLTIDAPAAQRVVSNTPEVSAEDVPDRAGWKRHVFAETAPLPSYLVALGVGPFDIVDGGSAGTAGTPLRYVAPNGRGPETAAVREMTPGMLRALEDYFGTPFPFPKLDSVVVPATVGFGAMENAGMITYQSTLMLARPFEDTLVFRRRWVAVGGHEMAHQWFGDLVTLAWWDDAWLNEAFATWMEDKVIDAYQPDLRRGWMRAYTRRRALDADRLASARRVHNPVNAKGDIWGAFDRITYDKGGQVLNMFEQWLGPERFRQGVRDYLRAHAGGSATSADFFAALAAVSEHPDAARKAFTAFIEQPGAPQLDTALRCEDGKPPVLDVTQHRFRPVGSTAAEMEWTTPACFRYRADGKLGKDCFEVTNGAHSFALAGAKSCPDWVTGNAGGVGHYLTRYDAASLARIVDHFSDLPEEEAVAFAGDAALMARTGLISIDQALAIAGPLLRHPSDGVKQGGVVLLDKLRDDWLLPARLQAKLDVIAQDLLPLAQRVGWVERAKDAEATRELRVELMPFAARYEARDTLRMHARELALRWLVKRDAVAANMVEPVLMTAGRYADTAFYDRLEGALLASNDRRERTQMLRGMSTVRDPKLRDRALALMLDPRVDGREAFYFLERGMLDDDANRVAAFDFVRAHFDALVAKLPPETPGGLATPLGELCRPPERATFVEFFGERAPRFLGGAKRYGEALESIDLCIAARAQ
jgi:alanyl aminopeptidase